MLKVFRVDWGIQFCVTAKHMFLMIVGHCLSQRKPRPPFITNSLVEKRLGMQNSHVSLYQSFTHFRSLGASAIL